MAILSEPGKILITGATHGIGKAAAELFCSRGWEVYGISGNGEDGCGAAMEKTLPGFHYRVADVSNEPEISALLGRSRPGRWAAWPRAAVPNFAARR